VNDEVLEMQMAMESELNTAALERLSALVDGELDAADGARRVCGEWRESAQLRTSWHAYHLIGDVLRSDDLACDAQRDLTFLAALRIRLEREPVVLAPRALDAALSIAAAQRSNGERSRSWTWWAPSAAAAGLVAVAGVMMLGRTPLGDRPGPGAAELAQAGASLASAAPPSDRLAQSDAAGVTSGATAPGGLVRDAQLDRYLAAHKQFAGSSALGIPSAFLRNATATESDR
jgi:sigma-E factor negative regulatory protein RseA